MQEAHPIGSSLLPLHLLLPPFISDLGFYWFFTVRSYLGLFHSPSDSPQQMVLSSPSSCPVADLGEDVSRGRGKGKKQTVVRSHEDPGSGDEVLPAYKRRGRPQKPLKEDTNGKEVGKIEEEEGDSVKAATPEKELKGPTTVEGGKKRNRFSQLKENSSSVLEENGAKVRSDFDDSIRPIGFRQNGSRRKSTPRRAAEAGVECK